jgi:hypothetical protein
MAKGRKQSTLEAGFAKCLFRELVHLGLARVYLLRFLKQR